jgi:hypothetical protein
MKIHKLVGIRLNFRVGVVLYSGEFGGIGHADGEFGMLFTNLNEMGRHVPENVTMCVPPSMVKPVSIEDEQASVVAKLCAQVEKLFNKYDLKYFDDRWNNVFSSSVTRTSEYEQ